MNPTIYDGNLEQAYASIDPVLNRWVQSKQFELIQLYKNEYIVRSVDVPHPRKAFQLWIDPPVEGSVHLHCCDHASPWGDRIGCSRCGPIDRLEIMLNEMHAWIVKQA